MNGDTREKLEDDARKTIVSGYVSVNDMRGWLDRQAAITCREVNDAWEDYQRATERELSELQAELDRAEHERDEWKCIAKNFEKFHDELQAKLDAYDQTHMDKNAVQSYNSDVQVVAEQKNEYTIELRHRCGATTSISVAFRLE